MLYLAIAHLAVVLVIAVRLSWGSFQIHWLRDTPPYSGEPAPKVSIIIAARNEQDGIEASVRSLMNQDYPAFETIVVDDRSTDQTGAILDSLSNEFPGLRVIHNQALPDDWLGKNHAMQLGADRADGAYLLFTDGDVIMEPSTISRAVRYSIENDLDHLALGPETPMPNAMLDSFVLVFSQLFSSYMRPWKAKDPGSPAHIGIGAFNLVRREVYQAIGGHSPIAMRPDDDIKLGKLVKLNGYHQEFAFGLRLVSVPWYRSIGEVIRGLEKNAFAGVEYRLSIIVLSTVALLAIDIWPYIAVAITTGAAQLLYGLIVVLFFAIQWVATFTMRSRWYAAFFFPITVSLMIYILWRASLLTLRQGGIRWRGTFYSLEKLKANRI